MPPKEQQGKALKMNVQVLAKSDLGQIVIDDQVREEAQNAVNLAHDRKFVSFKVELDDGSEIELPEHISKALVFTLQGLTQGNLTLRSMPDELTSSTAASTLGISRPTLMKLVESGELSSWKVGTHHRFNAVDVLELKAKRAADQRQAFRSLRELEDELGIED